MVRKYLDTEENDLKITSTPCARCKSVSICKSCARRYGIIVELFITRAKLVKIFETVCKLAGRKITKYEFGLLLGINAASRASMDSQIYSFMYSVSTRAIPSYICERALELEQMDAEEIKKLLGN